MLKINIPGDCINIMTNASQLFLLYLTLRKTALVTVFTTIIVRRQFPGVSWSRAPTGTQVTLLQLDLLILITVPGASQFKHNLPLYAV